MPTGGEGNKMKIDYKLIFVFVVCLLCGCPRSSAPVDAGSDVLDVPHGPVTSSDGSVSQ